MARGFVKPREVSTERAYRDLIAAILNRAIMDYINGYDHKKKEGHGYEFKTAESYLSSDRSTSDLALLDIPMTGLEIVEKIHNGSITKDSLKGEWSC